MKPEPGPWLLAHPHKCLFVWFLFGGGTGGTPPKLTSDSVFKSDPWRRWGERMSYWVTRLRVVSLAPLT